MIDRSFVNPLFSGQLLRLWSRILGEWTEVIQPMPNHYNAQHKTCSRIGRVWTSCPSNLLAKLDINSHVVGTPEEHYGNELSDHAPFVLSFGSKPRAEAATFSISKLVCNHLS